MMADEKEHRVAINKVHAVETMVDCLRTERGSIPDHRPMGAIPLGWENVQPTSTTLQSTITEVRAQLSANSEITESGRLKLKDPPQELKSMERVRNVRQQFEDLAAKMGEAEMCNANSTESGANAAPTPAADAGGTVFNNPVLLSLVLTCPCSVLMIFRGKRIRRK